MMESVIAAFLLAPVLLYWAWGKGLPDEAYRPRWTERDRSPIDPLLR